MVLIVSPSAMWAKLCRRSSRKRPSVEDKGAGVDNHVSQNFILLCFRLSASRHDAKHNLPCVVRSAWSFWLCNTCSTFGFRLFRSGGSCGAIPRQWIAAALLGKVVVDQIRSVSCACKWPLASRTRSHRCALRRTGRAIAQRDHTSSLWLISKPVPRIGSLFPHRWAFLFRQGALVWASNLPRTLSKSVRIVCVWWKDKYGEPYHSLQRCQRWSLV